MILKMIRLQTLGFRRISQQNRPDRTAGANHAKDMDWMKNEVRLWRHFAFLLLGVGVLLLILLVFYIGWDVAHPNSGLIRY